ncbi:hypothetical protein Pcinc_039780 [Petrolisthes cinctipes]|uniref:Uncharacterized protein n=1 Tax=Petrolisthes cinctipes TaxID=88211 RepID=A0AAE1BQI8_PETCI|nr:hypothetical protein Pcinc_039780 [Petrolisthes cinctipes]
MKGRRVWLLHIHTSHFRVIEPGTSRVAIDLLKISTSAWHCPRSQVVMWPQHWEEKQGRAGKNMTGQRTSVAAPPSWQHLSPQQADIITSLIITNLYHQQSTLPTR